MRRVWSIGMGGAPIAGVARWFDRSHAFILRNDELVALPGPQRQASLIVAYDLAGEDVLEKPVA
jgi:hypothetical protein